MQTLRLATAFLSQLSSPADALPIALTLERCCLSHGITFLSLGSTGLNGAAFLEQKNCISTLAAALTHTSFTIKWLPNWCLKEAKILAEEIFRMAKMTHGSANFRFGVSFNCPPGIPYFPAAEAPESGEESPCILDNGDASEGAATAKGTSSFALGLENSGLLYQAFKNAQIELQNAKKRGVELDPLAAAHAMLLSEATSALQPLETIAKEIELATPGVSYRGIDTSIAPALEPPTIPSAFECLGIGKFGASGTLAITERITAALKSIPVKRTGYCGLMLPVCEDQGLASAATKGDLTMENLLHWSAVCGVGLDTIPIACPGPNTSAAEREEFVCKVAGILLDVAALSNRLNNKPLSVRLLPVVGGKAGEKTKFNNPYLCESVIMDL